MLINQHLRFQHMSVSTLKKPAEIEIRLFRVQHIHQVKCSLRNISLQFQISSTLPLPS
jgi:hypothetical protein